MIFLGDQHFLKRTAFFFAASLNFMLLQNFLSASAHANSVWQVSSGSQYLFDSNYFKTNNNKVSEHTFRITPAASFSVQQDRSVLNFKYAGIYGINANETNENQLNHNIHSGFQIKLGKVSSFNFLAEYLTSRDERGVSASPVVSAAPLANWSGKKTAATITAPLISKTKIQIGGKLEERNYEAAYTGSSRNIIDLNVAGILPVTYKTAFRVKYAYQAISYHANSSNSSQLNRLSAGVSWKTTGKTTSYANFGVETNSTNKSSSRYSGLFADVRFRWQRKSYSAVDFKVSRKTTDTGNTTDGYLVSNILNLNWKHQYTIKWSSEIGSNLSLDQYESSRNDVYISPLLGIRLTQSKKLYYSAKITVNYRKSNQSALNYNGAIILAGLNIKFGGR